MSLNLVPPHTTSSDHENVHRDLVAVKEETPQAVLTDVVGVRNSKGGILRAGIPRVCGEENNRNDGTSRNGELSNLTLFSADTCNCNKEFKMNGRQ